MKFGLRHLQGFLSDERIYGHRNIALVRIQSLCPRHSLIGRQFYLRMRLIRWMRVEVRRQAESGDWRGEAKKGRGWNAGI